MSIEAINEQLLRAIGVGVALIDLDTLSLNFSNDTFDEWFSDAGPSANLRELFPDLDIDTLIVEMNRGGRLATETSFKLRRRTMTVAMEFNRASDTSRNIAVLVCQNITRIKELESMIDSYSVMVERNTHEIRREKEQVEKLLLNMMPRAAYEEYKTFGMVSPQVFEPVSVLSLEFVGFDDQLAKHDPGVIVSELNDIYSAFDRIGAQFSCQRIRTNGDSYVAVSGVPEPNEDHALAIANSAIRFLRYMERRNTSHPIKWTPRIGVSSGSVIGSVVGSQNYIYDVFGPSVSAAMHNRGIAPAMSVVSTEDFASHISETFQITPMAVDSEYILLEELAAPAQKA